MIIISIIKVDYITGLLLSQSVYFYQFRIVYTVHLDYNLKVSTIQFLLKRRHLE